MNIIGTPLALTDFEHYVQALRFDSWQPTHIVIHHCSAPSLAQRPQGFQPEHMRNLKAYYEGKGWHAGPHIFIDEHRAWLFSPLTARGVHAISFNSTSWGLEMLGDYDSEDPWSGRGLAVLTLTARIVAILLRKIHRDETAIHFHRDDPRTAKTCPGTRVNKARFLALVQQALHAT